MPQVPSTNAYLEAEVLTASPAKLVLLCYDGALRFLQRAESAFERNDAKGYLNMIGRCQAIVTELNATLDMNAGGEIAANLRDLYGFINAHLTEAVTKHDPKYVTEASGIIKPLRDSWREIVEAESPQASTQA